MTEEDEAFNDIERQAKQRIEAVKAQLVPLACERCKQLEEQAYDLLGQLKVANIKLAYTHPPKRTWVGLTEDDKVLIKHDANFNQFMTAGEYADRVQQLTEARLKEKNT